MGETWSRQCGDVAIFFSKKWIPSSRKSNYPILKPQLDDDVVLSPPLLWLEMGVSKNNGTPKSSILIGFSIIFTIHFGGFPPIFGNIQIFMDAPRRQAIPRWDWIGFFFIKPATWPRSRDQWLDWALIAGIPGGFWKCWDGGWNQRKKVVQFLAISVLKRL